MSAVHSWRISKNQGHRSWRDRDMERIEGVYPTLREALEQLDGMVAWTLPGGSMRIYDKDYEDVEEDTSGLHALGSIERVVP